MGNTCSQRADCTVEFTNALGSTLNTIPVSVLAIGGVKAGDFEPYQDIAGIGTVLALVAGTAAGLLVALLMTIGLILDRIPAFTKWSYYHPVVRTLVPSPSQLVPKKHWPHTRTEHTLPHLTGYSSTEELRPMLPTKPATPPQYHPSYPTFPGGLPVPTHHHQPLHHPQPQEPHHRRRHQQHPIQRPESHAPTDLTHDLHPVQQPPPSWQQAVATPPRRGEINHVKRNTIPETSYDILEAVLCCIHDEQLLLAIAVGLSFHFGTNCSMSQYHLDIAMNLSFIGCISFLLAFTLVRNYWASPMSSLIRVGCFVVVLVFLLMTSLAQENSGLMPEYEPPATRNHSLILLDAACFSNKTYSKELHNFTQTQSAILGATVGGKPLLRSYYRLLWVVVAASAVTGLIRIYQAYSYRTNGPARPLRRTDGDQRIGLRSKLLVPWWAVVLAGCTVIYIMTVVHIFKVRNWVSGSGWVKQDDFSSDPENDVRSFGQIAALVTTGSIVIAGFDRWKPESRETGTQ